MGTPWSYLFTLIFILIINKYNKIKWSNNCIIISDFKIASSLAVHLNWHSGARPYSCNICDKDFAQRGTLIIHMRTHSGVRPFLCKICSKGKIYSVENY